MVLHKFGSVCKKFHPPYSIKLLHLPYTSAINIGYVLSQTQFSKVSLVTKVFFYFDTYKTTKALNIYSSLIG